jgi:hypothetical protein
VGGTNSNYYNQSIDSDQNKVPNPNNLEDPDQEEFSDTFKQFKTDEDQLG